MFSVATWVLATPKNVGPCPYFLNRLKDGRADYIVRMYCIGQKKRLVKMA